MAEALISPDAILLSPIALSKQEARFEKCLSSMIEQTDHHAEKIARIEATTTDKLHILLAEDRGQKAQSVADHAIHDVESLVEKCEKKISGTMSKCHKELERDANELADRIQLEFNELKNTLQRQAQQVSGALELLVSEQ